MKVSYRFEIKRRNTRMSFSVEARLAGRMWAREAIRGGLDKVPEFSRSAVFQSVITEVGYVDATAEVRP